MLMSSLLMLHSIFFTNSIKDLSYLLKRSEKLQQALYVELFIWNCNCG